MSARGSHKKTSGIWHEFESKTRTTVECFPILLLYFVRTPGTVTRVVIGSLIPRFHSVNTSQARKQMSFHRQAPRRSKFMSREQCAVVEEREFSGKFLKCL